MTVWRRWMVLSLLFVCLTAGATANFYAADDVSQGTYLEFDSSFNTKSSFSVSQDMWGADVDYQNSKFYIYGDGTIKRYDLSLNIEETVLNSYSGTDSSAADRGGTRRPDNGHFYLCGDDPKVVEFDENGNYVTSHSVNIGCHNIDYNIDNNNFVYLKAITGNLRVVDTDFNELYNFDSVHTVGDRGIEYDEVSGKLYIGDTNGDIGVYDWNGKGSISLIETKSTSSSYVSALTTTDFNKLPKFNSTSVSPDPPLIGENVSYSAEVFDSDGSIQDTELLLTYGGSTVANETRTGTNPSFDDVFVPQTGNKYLNATLTTTDDAGATTTKEINRFLSDTGPNVSLVSPSGKVFDFDQGFQVNTQVDGDSRQGESLDCVLSLDSTQIDQRNVTEGTSYTVSDRADLGSHSASVTCTETDDQKTSSDNTSFTVEEFQLNSVSGVSQVFETENTSFTADLKAGDMVESVSSELLYDSSLADSKTRNISGISDFSESLSHTVSLVDNNQTSQSYKTRHTVEYTGFNGNTQTTTVNSSSKTQEVLHAYSFNQHQLSDGFTQLEASTLDYTASLSKDFASADGSTEASLSYAQTGQTVSGLQENRTHFSGTFDTDLIQDKTESFNLKANFTLSFNGDSRNIVDRRSLTLEKIILNKSNTGPETLKFEVRDETNNSQIKGDVAAGIQVNNPDQPGKTRFYGFDFSKAQTHSVYLQPNTAEINANIFNKRSIEYSNTDQNYPERRYFLTDTLLDNETTNINLYLLKANEGSTVRIELQDSDLTALPDHLIRIERAFPDKEETRTVALTKTGGDGFGSTFLKLQEQYIYTIFNSDGELIDQIGPQTLTTSTETLEVTDEIPPGFANLVNQVKFTDIQEQNQSLSVSYVSETDRLNNLFLEVSDDSLFGSELISVDSSEQIQGRLEVSGFNASEQRVFYELIGTFGETNITMQTGTYGTQSSDYGDAGIFVSFLMFMAMSLTGLFRPSASIGLGVVAVFVMAFTGLLGVGQTALISLAALAAVLIWRMSS